jgi:hypothetical protein
LEDQCRCRHGIAGAKQVGHAGIVEAKPAILDGSLEIGFRHRGRLLNATNLLEFCGCALMNLALSSP